MLERNLTIEDFKEFNLDKEINLSRLENMNIKLLYVDQNEENRHTCVVIINNDSRLEILTTNKEKMLKWLIEDIKKYI